MKPTSTMVPNRSNNAPNYWLHAGLFVVTCGTTFLSGSGIGSGFDAIRGGYFSATIMTILLCHEMGHYFVARHHGIRASLPYFIPLPPVISLGTLGAVIQMDEPIEDRNSLLHVGAAGPLAGIVAAIPLLLVGLYLSPLSVTSPASGAMSEGNSALYLLLKFLVHGMILPSDNGLDVQLHPIGFAAWVGLLITMINLIPIGQLDGGHIACAALGDRHERFSRVLHWLLLVLGCVVVLFCIRQYSQAGRETTDALVAGTTAGLPWIVWSLMLLIMRRMSDGRYHPPIGGPPLSRQNIVFVAFMLFVFATIFTPIPLRQAL